MTSRVPTPIAVAVVVAASGVLGALAGCASPVSAASGSPAAVGAGSTGPGSRGLGSTGADGAQFDPAPTRSPLWGPGDPPTSTDGQPEEATTARDVTAVKPFIPSSLTLPSGRVVPVRSAGVASDGALVVPADPAQAGWWTGGARPGDHLGSVVVAAHIDSRRYGIGALAELARARPGQSVTVSAGGQSIAYTVRSLQQIPKAALVSTTDAFRQDVAARLVLITCGGPYDASRHAYRDNLVVVATPAT